MNLKYLQKNAKLHFKHTPKSDNENKALQCTPEHVSKSKKAAKMESMFKR
jgi:hypothetical protein